MTSLNPVLSVGFQITEAILAHRDVSAEEAKREAIDLLHKVEIPDPERRFGDYPQQFSGGMRQRVMIAMALACKPSLLIADEPTTALDVTTQARILDIIQRLKEEMNMAVLFITHDLGIVSEIADRVMVMYCGSIIEKADTRNLFNAPSHPYTSGLILSMPAVGSARGKGVPLPAIPGTVPAVWQGARGCTFSPRCSYAIERCRHETPLLQRRNPHSFVEVACHRAAEIRSMLGSLLPWVEAGELGITA
jgi:oligopeptide/dipeptide ABC transporter ATP-binding protein